MIREYELAEDNNQIESTIVNTASSANGSFFVETGFVVSWGIVQNSSAEGDAPNLDVFLRLPEAGTGFYLDYAYAAPGDLTINVLYR